MQELKSLINKLIKDAIKKKNVKRVRGTRDKRYEMK
jgi:hypothetical protein